MGKRITDQGAFGNRRRYKSAEKAENISTTEGNSEAVDKETFPTSTEMAGASDKARFYLEQAVPQLHEFEQKKIFTKVRSTAPHATLPAS
jgi:hypothetical protein